MYDQTRYNELWRYDLTSLTWSSLKSNGEIPSPRSHHSADSHGDIMIIFGGKDNNIYYNDAYEFNTLTLTWTVLKYKETNPSPRFSACLMVNLPLMYIYGGETRSGLSSEVFIYNLSDTTYRSLNSQTMFKVGSGHSCFLNKDQESFDVVYGRAEGDEPLGYVLRYDLRMESWKVLYSPSGMKFNRNRPAVAKVGTDYFVFGGSSWATKVNKEVIKIDTLTNSSQLISEISQITYQSAFTQNKNHLFIYGGGSAFNSLIRYNVPNRNLLKIDLTDLCSPSCTLLCSPGSYFNTSTQSCESCKAGFYSENYSQTACTPCHKGTFNNKTGASSRSQCYPCEYGSYNEKEAAVACLTCLGGFICPAGSTAPLFNETKAEIISIQPKNFHRQSEKASSIFYLVEISLIVAGVFVIIGIILVTRLRNCILKLDNFQTVHNYKLDSVVIKRKTLLGGIFTFLYLIAAFLILAKSLILFEVDNESESKSLVPLVVLEETVRVIEGSFVVTVTLMNYGGECVVSQLNFCARILKVIAMLC